MDIWNFKTQGFNYEKYRPEYPQELCRHAIDQLSNKKRYLDIAVGTGKILLSFCENFEEVKGIDLSEQMLSVASANVQKFMESHPTHSIVLSKNHVMDLSEEEKFDLITVGQALHFFPGEAILRKIRNMLNEGGMFMTFGYVLREVKSENPLENEVFYEFYNKMLPYFTFDMYELHHHYSDKTKYPFEAVFEKVDRKQTDLVLSLTKEEYINYLKTWSAYNIYVDKHGLDPIIELLEKSAEKLTCVFDYFRVRCFR